MSRSNVRMLSHEIPLMQIQRKARFEAMERDARTDEVHSMQMAGGLILFGLLVTAIALAAAWL